MNDFLSALQHDKIVIFDGAMGTLLQERGLPAGASPELWCLENQDVLRSVHVDYLRAGSMAVTTNTFGGTRYKLGDVDVTEVNRVNTQIARQAVEEAVGGKGWVAGGMGPTGHFVSPLGDVSFKDMVAAYAEQARGLAQGGADLILIETHYDLAEMKAAVMGAREVCDVPVAVSMTFESSVSLTGSSPLSFLDTAQNLGVDMVASNCSAGPAQFEELVKTMLRRLRTPLLVYPNAGLPELQDGQTVFPMGPEEFAERTARLAALGAQCVGGCCGTTPAHMNALAKAVAAFAWSRPEPLERECVAITSRSRSTCVGYGRPAVIVGERINPTGKKQLTADLQEGKLQLAMAYAEEQTAAGAGVLDVNVGAPMVKEVELLPEVVKALVSRFHAPLCLDSPDPEALKAALDVYPASPLINSISGDPGRMEELGPICARYGAPFILLPLKGRNLPVTAAERTEAIEDLLQRADAAGVPRRLAIVDVLALTVSSKPEAAQAALDTIRYCRDELNIPTVIGLSNVSFGLPARELVNSTFLAMAMAEGLSACIANPGSSRLQETMAAAEVLLARDAQAQQFIARYAEWKPGEAGPAGGQAGAAKKSVDTLKQAVITGDKQRVLELLDAALDKGAKPFALINDELIPGITKVGDMYETGEYFLPQLILSAETMQAAFDKLKPLLEEDAEGGPRKVVVMATVEGDIHDIGKNIVNLMLRNYGFEVIDLGKDVASADIVLAAKENNAAVIGLSALMTTTMVKMQETIEKAKEAGLSARVMVGGAVVTQAFADSIGADGYARDAVSAVRVAKELAGVM